jgi:hypothetical protein
LLLLLRAEAGGFEPIDITPVDAAAEPDEEAAAAAKTEA